MEKLKTFLVVFWFILGILLLIPTLFYLIHFFGGKLSDNPATWGTFGDYFGGLFNPLIGLANLIIFIKLTVIVAEMQDKSTAISLSFEKKVLTSGLMHDSVKDISKLLNSLGSNIIANRQQTDWEILKVKQALTTFSNNYSHLFSDLTCTNVWLYDVLCG